MTKKCFDEDDSQREISRLKKELRFMEMQVYNQKRSAYVQSKEEKNRDIDVTDRSKNTM